MSLPSPAMSNRPISVTVAGWLFIATGIIGLVYHASEWERSPGSELVWIELVRLLAVVGGVFLLRGHNWARRLLIAWLAYHVALSAFHSMSELVTHVVLLGVISWVLFRPDVTLYLRPSRS